MGTGALVVISVLWILWRRRACLAQDQGRHIQDAYLLHNEQARCLALYPVTVLEGVNRFYEKRPMVVQGLYSTLFGGNTLTLASVGALLGLVRGFFDLHALGPADGEFKFDLWTGLFFFLSIAAIARWVRVKRDLEHDLLTEAIVLASIRENGVSNTGPATAT